MSSKTIAQIACGKESTQGRGRPGVVTQEMLHFMDVNWAADASLSDEGMMEMVNNVFGMSISQTTVLRCRTKLKFVYRPPKVIQMLTQEQKELRVMFCHWILAHRDEFEHILFTDESRFQVGPDNKWRRIRRGTVNKQCFVEKKKFPRSLMVWGGISLGYRSPLIKCSNGVNSDEYIEILQSSGAINELNQRYGRGKWYFLQDGASCHTSQKVQQFFECQKISIVPGWPPNSPDLNPIEMLWGS